MRKVILQVILKIFDKTDIIKKRGSVAAAPAIKKVGGTYEKLKIYQNLGGGGVLSKRSHLNRHIEFCRDFSLGFTLAEVLITLGVIGVVAVMTMPTLIENHKKKVTVEKLKTNYSIIQNVIESSKNDNGDVVYWDFELDNEEFAETYIIPYLNSFQKVSYGGIGYYNVMTLKGDYKSIYWWGVPIYFLNNEASIILKHGWNSTNDDIFIVIDINGKKSPNIMGKDAFLFFLNKTTNQLLPFGAGNSRDYYFSGGKYDGWGACSKNEPSPYYAGALCGALIITDGWQIADDYPW